MPCQVVVATNVAETSVTLEGVSFVVDCCFARQRCFNPLTGLESLLVAPISKASAAQRAGRAGRVRPGHAFRLCTEAAFEALPEGGVPEAQRADLAGAVLRLKALGVDNLLAFDWPARPPAEAVVRALESLHALGALDDNARLSAPLGAQLAELPLEPPLARMLLAGAALKCAREVATVVAMLSVAGVWAPGERRTLDEARSRWGLPAGGRRGAAAAAAAAAAGCRCTPRCAHALPSILCCLFYALQSVLLLRSAAPSRHNC